jgi:hypothetical protein
MRQKRSCGYCAIAHGAGNTYLGYLLACPCKTCHTQHTAYVAPAASNRVCVTWYCVDTTVTTLTFCSFIGPYTAPEKIRPREPTRRDNASQPAGYRKRADIRMCVG